MTTCAWLEERLTAYVHAELSDDEATQAAAHVEACAACGASLEGIRRADALLGDLVSEDAPPAVWRRLDERRARRPWALLAIPAAAAVFLVWLFAVRDPGVRLIPEASASADEERARDLHRRRKAGEVELGILTEDSAELVEWIRARAGQAPELAHGSRVKGAAYLDGVVLVALEVDAHPVSLVMTPRGESSVAEGWLDKEIHYREDAGDKALIWSREDHSYVLVSDLEGVGQRGCFACHTSARVRDLIDTLAETGPPGS